MDDKVKYNHKCLLAYSFMFVAFNAYAFESMEALELLNKYTETQNAMQSVILSGECLPDYNHSSRGQILRRKEYEIGTNTEASTIFRFLPACSVISSPSA